MSKGTFPSCEGGEKKEGKSRLTFAGRKNGGHFIHLLTGKRRRKKKEPNLMGKKLGGDPPIFEKREGVFYHL